MRNIHVFVSRYLYNLNNQVSLTTPIFIFTVAMLPSERPIQLLLSNRSLLRRPVTTSTWTPSTSVISLTPSGPTAQALWTPRWVYKKGSSEWSSFFSQIRLYLGVCASPVAHTFSHPIRLISPISSCVRSFTSSASSCTMNTSSPDSSRTSASSEKQRTSRIKRWAKGQCVSKWMCYGRTSWPQVRGRWRSLRQQVDLQLVLVNFHLRAESHHAVLQ